MSNWALDPFGRVIGDYTESVNAGGFFLRHQPYGRGVRQTASLRLVKRNDRPSRHIKFAAMRFDLPFLSRLAHKSVRDKKTVAQVFHMWIYLLAGVARPELIELL